MTYYKDENEGIQPERRKQAMEIQQAVLKLIAKVETMETNIELKLETVKDKIQNLDDKMSERILTIHTRLENHCDDDENINDILDEHDKSIEKAKSYIDRIHNLETKYVQLNDKVDSLSNASIKAKAQIVDDLGSTFKKTLFGAFSAGFVGLILFILIMYIKSLG